jgi:hypothetical protein
LLRNPKKGRPGPDFDDDDDDDDDGGMIMFLFVRVIADLVGR